MMKYKALYFLILIVSLFSFWQMQWSRLQPQNSIQQIATGITYLRIVRTIPHQWLIISA